MLQYECDKAGVTIHTVLAQFDTSPEGRLMRSIAYYVAETERVRTLERTARGKQAALAAGKFQPSRAPLYGYQRTPESKYVIDPETGSVVRRIFADCLAGRTLAEIARDLDAAGIPTPERGKDRRKAARWDFTTLGKILRNEKYTGRAYANIHRKERRDGKYVQTVRPRDEWILLPEGTIEPLIDAATFSAVAERLKRNQKYRSGRQPRDPERHLLRGGYIRCGACGWRMPVRTSRSRGVEYSYYACRRKDRNGAACTPHYWKPDDVDRAVWGRFVDAATTPDQLEAELRRLADAAPGTTEQTALADANRALERLSAQQARMAERLSEMDETNDGPLFGQYKKLSAERRELVRRRDELAARQTRQDEARAEIAWVRDAIAAGELRLITARDEIARLRCDPEYAQWYTDDLQMHLESLPYAEKRQLLTASTCP